MNNRFLILWKVDSPNQYLLEEFNVKSHCISTNTIRS